MGNPKGYEDWFKGRQRVVLEDRLHTRTKPGAVTATVEELQKISAVKAVNSVIRLI